ncbi:FAD-dependent protein [Pontibacter sp. G13]|uniref:NAD(P)/FAD-dependent oxidoreductase n=1 Tax=Pontibacter sp. G13 TaxID=3074898 RepID=UPI00288BED8A|nr:FAD-binding protein [Pontibacter sp. G13]WNJ19263.1 FAD-binding protein [Pontibacter sp. G13]
MEQGIHEASIKVFPKDLHNADVHRKKIARKIGKHPKAISAFELVRRSIDARKGEPQYVLRFRVATQDAQLSHPTFDLDLQNVSDKKPAYIIGFGPAGMFAAIKLIQRGIKPIVIERGKAVRDRRRDLAQLTKEGKVNPESNYCFGEGGAGTFSDGKLYTRSTKRGNTLEVLNTLVHFGATEEILIETHPHIGTNKLPKIIEAMREQIIACGGEVRFDTKLTDFFVDRGELTGIELNGSERIDTKHVILATGHSARDIFRLLDARGIEIEAKPYALGVRIEHPQPLIDSIQYHCEGPRDENLPAASYSIVHQVADRGVYSFCMCPGGIICPAATEDDEIVVNGWSPSKRNSPFANSGMVVELELKDFAQFGDSPLAGMEFQRAIEQQAYQIGGGLQKAPAARMMDFVQGKVSNNLPDCSYLPGIVPVDLGEVLPSFVRERLQHGFRQMGRRMKGYLTNDAVVVGVESRTSSPVRIPRSRETLTHPAIEGLYPCGEGAGYAGGIMSAAMDGYRCAEALALVFKD